MFKFKKGLLIILVTVILLSTFGMAGFAEKEKLPVGKINGKEVYLQKLDIINHYRNMFYSIEEEKVKEEVEELADYHRKDYEELVENIMFIELLAEKYDREISTKEDVYSLIDKAYDEIMKDIKITEELKKEYKEIVDNDVSFSYSYEEFENKKDAENYIKAIKESEIPEEALFSTGVIYINENDMLKNFKEERNTALYNSKLSNANKGAIGGGSGSGNFDYYSEDSLYVKRAFEQIENLESYKIYGPIKVNREFDSKDVYIVFLIGQIVEEEFEEDGVKSFVLEKEMKNHKNKLLKEGKFEIYDNKKLVEKFMEANKEYLVGTLRGHEIKLDIGDITYLEEIKDIEEKEYDTEFKNMISYKIQNDIIEFEEMDSIYTKLDEEVDKIIKDGNNLEIIRLGIYYNHGEGEIDPIFIKENDRGLKGIKLIEKAWDLEYELTEEDKKLLSSLSSKNNVNDYRIIDLVFKDGNIINESRHEGLEDEKILEEIKNLKVGQVSSVKKTEDESSWIGIRLEEDKDVKEIRYIIREYLEGLEINKMYEEIIFEDDFKLLDL